MTTAVQTWEGLPGRFAGRPELRAVYRLSVVVRPRVQASPGFRLRHRSHLSLSLLYRHLLLDQNLLKEPTMRRHRR